MELLFDVGCKNALMATGLAILAASCAWLFHRPALTHALWLLVLLKLVTPPFWPVYVPVPTIAQPDITVTATTAGKDAEKTDFASNTTNELFEPSFQESTDLIAATSAYTNQDDLKPERETNPLDISQTGNEAVLSFRLKPALFSVWLTGAVAWFALAGWRLWQFRRLLRFAQPVSAKIQDQVSQYAHQLGLTRTPSAWMVPGAVSPMLWALVGRPRLLLPADLWERMNETQRATLLVHELAHLCRRDHWVRLLELVAGGLFWWHPVVWWAKRELRQAEEECCDAWVVWALPRSARDYALALMETVDFLSEVRFALPAAVSGIGHVHFLKRRLAMIMLGTTSRNLSRLGFLALVALGALLLPLAPSWAQPGAAAKAPPDDPASKPPAKKDVSPYQPPNIALVEKGDAKRYALGLVSSQSVDEAKDEIELLQAQLQIKEAEALEAQARYEQARKRLDRLKDLKGKGVLSQEEFAKAEDEAALMRAQLEPKEAQIAEAKIRLGHARRRLARLTETSKPPPHTTSSGATASITKSSTTTVPTSDVKDELKALMHARAALELRVKELEDQLNRSRVNEQQMSELMKRYYDAVNDKISVAEKLQKELQEKGNYANRIRDFERAMAEYQKALEIAQTGTSAKPPEPDKAKSLKALETRLDALARELEMLRKELKNYSSQSVTPGPGTRVTIPVEIKKTPAPGKPAIPPDKPKDPTR